MKRLIIATFLWAIVLNLGVWDYYLLKFPPCNLPKVYQEVLMPVVKIETASGTGSGVIISSEAGKTYILTAAHVVGDESTVQVSIYEYEPSVINIETASVVITDTDKDLALIITRHSSFITYRSARLITKEYKPYLFTPIYAVGCSLGLDPRPSEGIISAVSNTDWEISAPIIPGNSGGGVFLKSTHELIGIAVWIRTYGWQLIPQMSGIVPINQIYEFLDKTPLMNCEEHKSGAETVGQAGVPSAQSGQEGPVGQPNR